MTAGAGPAEAPLAAVNIGEATVGGNLTVNMLDPEVFFGMWARERGYLSPEQKQALEDQLARTQADLEKLRADSPAWAAEVDAVIAAFNRSDLEGARAAFARIDALMARRRTELAEEERALRREQARSKHAQATLLYPFTVSLAEPLLTEAAELAETDFSYWIEAGRARVALGRLASADAAFRRALDLATVEDDTRNRSVALNKLGDVQRAQGDLTAARTAYAESLAIARDLAARDPGNAGWARDVSVSLERLGDVQSAQGDLPAARTAYAESLAIARDLAARDPGNAEWARDVWVSLWRMAQADPENAVAHWTEVVARLEAMQAQGTLAPVDVPFIEAARQNLAAARE